MKFWSRTETPWHLTDGNGSSTEPTDGQGRWEKLEASYSEFHQWPWVVDRWKASGNKITYNLAENFAKTYSGKAITQSKVPSSSNIDDKDAGLVPNITTGWNEENASGIKSF